MQKERATGKTPRFTIRLTAFLAVVLLVWGCGSSRQNAGFEGDEVQIDDLVTGQDADAKKAEDAEVLRLLGITPADTESGESNVSEAMQTETTESKSDVDQLKQELDNKDREISLLRTELTQKELKITELEDKVISEQRRKPQGRTHTSDYKSGYQSALAKFNSRDYEGGLASFSELLLNDANNSLSDNCQYWIGECYYGLGNYNQSIAEFEKVFSFPNSNKSDAAQLKLGLCYLRLGDKQQARAEFDRLISNYPNSEYRPVAERHLAKL